MGSEESKPKRERVTPMPRTPPRNQFSEAEVAQLLERQKQHFDQKVQQIIKLQNESKAANTSHSPTAVASQAGPSTTNQAVRNTHPLVSPTAVASQASPSPTTQAARNTHPLASPAAVSSKAASPIFPVAGNAHPLASTSAVASQASPSPNNQAARNTRSLASPAAVSSKAASPMSQVAGNAHPLAFERNRTPYNYTQSHLNRAAVQQIYPDLNNIQQRTSAADFVFVNRPGNAERPVPVPSAPPAPRDRSSSRPRSRKEDDQNEVKCPTCKRMYGLTIFQCSNGHSSCNDCKKANRVCGKCYKPIGNMRNIMMEEVVSEMKVKCPYSEDGCNLFIKMAEIENHAKECPFRELSCPMPGGCLWKGKLCEVADHFDVIHPMNRQGAVDTEMTLSTLQNNYQIAHLVVMGSFNFIFHLMVNKVLGNIYMAVQLIGTNMSASKWTYDIQVYNKSAPRRKFQHVDVCTTTNTKIGNLISEARCAVIPLSYATTFLCDNKLNYKFYIKKEANERPLGNNRGRGRGRGRGARTKAT